MKASLRSLSALILGAIGMSHPHDAAAQAANFCSCKSSGSGNYSYSSQSGPPGICTVAEDVSMCSTSQMQVGPGFRLHEVQRGPLARSLKSAGVEMEPEEALRIAGLTRPESWNPDQAPDILSVMLSLSLGAAAPDRLPSIRRALAEHATDIMKGFAGSAERIGIRIGDYDAVVGYGFLELAQGTFKVRTRTPFAP
jgi:hypothetical protein